MKSVLSFLLFASISVNITLFVWLHNTPEINSSASTVSAVVMRTAGGLLEVSTITSEERFDSSKNHTVLGVSVGKTVAQIRVLATYRYHIPLAKDWKMHQAGNALVVIAPAVRPSLPVAFDSGKLESFAYGIWSPFTGDAAKEELKINISKNLSERAAFPDKINIQRESARYTVVEFIQKWVVQQPKWRESKTPTVLVFFEDEPLGRSAAPVFAQ